MKRLAGLVAVALALSISSQALAWGPIGHRVTAELAERNISGETRARIALILGNESLAEASTWPDEERSNPDPFWQEEASPWHYVTLPADTPATEIPHPPEGDAVTALEKFAAVLRDPRASREDKQLALRFVVHIVGDLHQPFHAGSGTDRGGNDVKVRWFDLETNLHWVWDEGIINQQQLSYSEYTDRLAKRTTPEEVIEWWTPDPAKWIAESAELRDRAYPVSGQQPGTGSAEDPVILSYPYLWQFRAASDQRLMQAGIRMAAYLDWVFGN